MNRQLNLSLERKVKNISRNIEGMDLTLAKQLVWGEAKSKLEQLMHQFKPTIAMAGNIGFGKTTLAKLIGEKGRARVFAEDTKNPLLGKYYEDMEAYGLALQVNLSDTRLYEMVINKMQFPNEPLVYDRSHYEDPFIFAEVLNKSGLMTNKAKELCQWYFNMRKERLEQQYDVDLTPDVIVSVSGNIRAGWRRAKERNRSMEIRKDSKRGVGLTLDFYKTLQNEYRSIKNVFRQEFGGVVLTLPQSQKVVSDIANPRGQLYVVLGVTAALEEKYGPTHKNKDKV